MYRGERAVAVSAIGKLESLLVGLARVPFQVAIKSSPKINGLLLEQFKTGRNPYGQPWAPLKPATLATGRTPPPLTGFSRKLRNGTIATARPGGLAIRMGASYWYFHAVGYRVGKTRVPIREILPSKGWPRRWLAALNESAVEVMRDLARGV